MSLDLLMCDFDQIPQNVCVYLYHENIKLILQELQGHTNLSSNFSDK